MPLTVTTTFTTTTVIINITNIIISITTIIISICIIIIIITSIIGTTIITKFLIIINISIIIIIIIPGFIINVTIIIINPSLPSSPLLPFCIFPSMKLVLMIFSFDLIKCNFLFFSCKSLCSFMEYLLLYVNVVYNCA